MRSFLLLSTFAISSVAAFAQDAPPIKMGLWERTIETTGSLGTPSTNTVRSCVTPATWQRMVTNANRQHDNCKIETTKVSGGYTFSASCPVRPGMTVDISGNAKFTDSEHIVSESHTAFNMNGQKRESNVQATSHFLSADCGSVKPADSEPSAK
jgi:hypothetical protein